MGKTSLKIKVGVFSLSMLTMSTLIVSPIMSSVVNAFPNNSLSEVQMILSVANLTGIIAAFLVGRLALSIPKRTIALIGVAMTFIFGLIPYAFHDNLLILIICSGLVGVSVGFITNVIPGLIAQYFTIEERQGAMGTQVVFVSLGMMILMYVSGALGANNWYQAYLTYIGAGIIFFVTWFCLPKKEQETATSQNKKSLADALNKYVIIVAILGFCFMVVNSVFNNNISLLIAEKNIGGSDVAGTVTMLGQLGGLITGLLVGRIAKLVKTKMIVLSFIVLGCSFILLSVASNLPMIVVGSFLARAGQTLFFSQAPFMITILVHPMLIPMGMAVLSTANSIGGFLSPVIVNALNELFIGSSVEGTMIIGGVLSFIISIFTFISDFQKKSMLQVEKKEG